MEAVAKLANFRLKVFRAVAEYLSFRRAGEELYLTQPAVTLQIKALEEEIGTPLFDRTGTHISLTPAGQPVVGAAAKFGVVILAVGTTVKLAKALWIVPVSVATAVVKNNRAKIQWPWFIGLFCLAALADTKS